MSGSHNVGNFQGPRLPSEENNESEIDPEKFRRISKVEETDDSQQKKKKQPMEETEDEEGEVQEEKAPTLDFSSFMSDQESDSDLNVQQAKGNVRRAPTNSDASSDTQMYSSPRASASQFQGKDQGEELGDELFGNLEPAPPEYGEAQEPSQPAPAPAAPAEQGSPQSANEQPAQPTTQEPQENNNVSQPDYQGDVSNVSEPQTNQDQSKNSDQKTDSKAPKKTDETKKKKGEKDLKPLQLETDVKPDNKHKVDKEEISTMPVTQPKQAKDVKPSSKVQTAPIEEPKEITTTPGQFTSEKEKGEDGDSDHQHQKEPNEIHDTHGKKEKPKEEEEVAKPGFSDAVKKTKNKPSSGATDEVVAAAAGEIPQPIKSSGSLEDNETLSTSKSGSKKGKKNSISQPSTPVLFSSDGEVLTSLSKDHDKQEDQQDQQVFLQVDAPAPITAPPPIEAPAYSKLNPETFELFEKLVGLMTIESYKGKSTTTVELNMPNSVFDKAKVVLEHFDTAPNSFNLQLQGSDEAVNMFNASMGELAAAFEGSKLAYEVNIRRPILSEKHRTGFFRKSTDYEGDGQNKDK
ncbi:MAG: hypothetical protein P0S95_07960 [Rhabdochlamydiaceae bacterium]|nr:hypothetical protein [Candidatus Amphrikana amoebophyrae]